MGLKGRMDWFGPEFCNFKWQMYQRELQSSNHHHISLGRNILKPSPPPVGNGKCSHLESPVLHYTQNHLCKSWFVIFNTFMWTYVQCAYFTICADVWSTMALKKDNQIWAIMCCLENYRPVGQGWEIWPCNDRILSTGQDLAVPFISQELLNHHKLWLYNIKVWKSSNI